MYNSKEDSKLITKIGLVFKAKKLGLKFKNAPQEILGKVTASGKNEGEAVMKVFENAEKEYGKGISIKFN